MTLKHIYLHAMGLVFIAGIAGAQTRTLNSAATGGAERASQIQVLKLNVGGPNCQARHCDVDLTDANALTPHPIENLPQDHLYVRVFRGTLADVMKSRAIVNGCFVFSAIREELDNSNRNGTVIFGARMENLLSDIGALSDSPHQVNTVVMVFETEPSTRLEGDPSFLRLKTDNDVKQYFQYAIEVTFRADHNTYAAWLNLYSDRQKARELLAKENQQGPYHSGSFLSSLGAAIADIFVLPVHAQPKSTPPDTPAAANASTPSPFAKACSSVASYYPTHVTYDVAVLTPVAGLTPIRCGE